LVAVPSIGRASEVTPRRAAPEADATRDLYERYARQIYTYCLHQLGNREEAEDAVQSTFLNAFRGYQRGVDPEFESAWLYKIAQNVCLTRQRSSSRRRRVETASDLDAMQDYVPAHEFDADELINLPEALDAMPHQQRKALLLREWQGLSYKEIADELELSQAAVETLLFRARRTLAAGLSEEPAKKSVLRSLRSGGDAGSALAILKSLLFTGGAKVATAVATVAATSVVVATPTARHAVEDVVTPGHDRALAPAHHIARTPASGGAPASSRVIVPARETVLARRVAAKPHKTRGRRAPAALVVTHLGRPHAPAPASAPGPAAQVPATVDTTPVPAEPAAAAAPAAPQPSEPAPAPAASQPASAPAPEKPKGDEKNADGGQAPSTPAATPPPAAKDQSTGTKKYDVASNDNKGNGNGGGNSRSTSSSVLPSAAPAPAADPAPQSNGNGKGNGNGNAKQADAPVSVPAAPAPVATTTTASTPPPTTTATPAEPQPAVTTTPSTPPAGNGNGGNGNGHGYGQGHRK
jgi:RNA polymerase sigma factor (sigma-70 family)